MSNSRIVTIRELADEIGMDYLQAVELHRRINRRVLDDDVICITQTIGTFYKKKMRATTKTLNGITYQVPYREAVALRGPRFPGRVVGLRLNVVGFPGWQSEIVSFTPPDSDTPMQAEISNAFVIDPSFNVRGSTWNVDVSVSVDAVTGSPVDSFVYQYQYRAECVGVNSPSQFVNVWPMVHETHTGELVVTELRVGHVVESTGVVRRDRFNHTNRSGSVGNQNGAPTRPFQFTLMVDVDETGQRP